MSGWEFLDRHWLAACLLGLALLFVIVVVGSAWASRRRSIVVNMQVEPGGEPNAGEVLRLVRDLDKERPS